MDGLNFNIFNIIIFSGIVQGVIFSLVVFFVKKYRSVANNFIALTVLVLSLSNLQYWFIDVEVKGVFSVFRDLRIPCDLLIVPSFFLYVNSYLQRKNSKRLIFLLSLPFIISLVFNLLLFYNTLFSESVHRTINIILETFSFAFNLLLIFIIIWRIRAYEKNNKEYKKSKVKPETKWLKQILFIGGAMCVFWFGEIIYMQTKHNTGLSIYYPLWISISFLIYWISYVALYHSKIYNERRLLRSSVWTKAGENQIDNHNSKRTNDDLFNKIFSWIVEDKVYLNPGLTLNMVANEFNISTGYLSQLISAHNDLNFNDLINKLRVEDAKKMLLDEDFDKYTILSVAYETGFNSKSSFYHAFKKFTNKTPAVYKKEVRNN